MKNLSLLVAAIFLSISGYAQFTKITNYKGTGTHLVADGKYMYGALQSNQFLTPNTQFPSSLIVTIIYVDFNRKC
jgi:hypothetical protein